MVHDTVYARVYLCSFALFLVVVVDFSFFFYIITTYLQVDYLCSFANVPYFDNVNNYPRLMHRINDALIFASTSYRLVCLQMLWFFFVVILFFFCFVLLLRVNDEDIRDGFSIFFFNQVSRC